MCAGFRIGPGTKLELIASTGTIVTACGHSFVRQTASSQLSERQIVEEMQGRAVPQHHEGALVQGRHPIFHQLHHVPKLTARVMGK